MKRFIILIAFLFGYASCVTFKEKLFNDLAYYETQLNEGLINATNHGFRFFLTDYNRIVADLKTTREHIQAFEGEERSKAGEDLYHEVDDLCQSIVAVVDNPFPKEMLKYRALYLAVIKQVSNLSGEATIDIHTEKNVASVIQIVDKEMYIYEHITDRNLEKAIAELNQMFAELEESMKQSIVPLFFDHYNLANRTRRIIQEQIKHNMTDQANDLQAKLKQFDDLTLALANAFPIKQKEGIDKFIDIIRQHYQLRLVLKDIKHIDTTVKDALLLRLNNVQNVLTAAIQEYQKTPGAYANVLSATLSRIAKAREAVAALDDEIDGPGAEKVNFQVGDLEAIIPLRIVFPESNQSIRGAALNFAARQVPDQGKAIYDVVQDVIFYEYSLHSLPSIDETTKAIAEASLANKYAHLKSLTTEMLFLEDYEALLYKARELYQASKTAPAWYGSFCEFEQNILKLHPLLPLDTGSKARVWYDQAKVINDMFNKIKPTIV